MTEIGVDTGVFATFVVGCVLVSIFTIGAALFWLAVVELIMTGLAPLEVN